MDPQVNVNYSCQRCQQLIHLDSGFSHLNQLTLAELALPIYCGEEVDFTSMALDKLIKPFQLNEPNGFTVLGVGEFERRSPLKVTSQLFDLLSNNSDIDHPLCEECTDGLLDMMDETLNRTQYQARLYKNLFNQNSDMVRNELDPLEKELRELEEEEAQQLLKLEEVLEEQRKAKEHLSLCYEEKKRLDEEEDNYYREYCTYKCQKQEMENENRSLRSCLSYMQHQLDRLRQTNVFNATFHIWFAGYFGTINNLRLGRLPTSPVSWQELNAAWGQTALLLASLARKSGFEFSKYKLVPHGNTSYIEEIGNNLRLPLFGSASGLKFLWDNGFDAAMAAFLKCAKEFQEFIENNGSSNSKSFYLPYTIEDCRMVDSKQRTKYLMRMQLNSLEEWTKSQKYLLTNLKWALTWVSSSVVNKTEEEATAATS